MASDLFRQYNQIRQGMQNMPPNGFGGVVPNQQNFGGMFQGLNIRELFQNPVKFFQTLNQFKSMINGNPEQIGMQMMQSGQLNQSVLSQLAPIANEIRKLLPR